MYDGTGLVRNDKVHGSKETSPLLSFYLVSKLSYNKSYVRYRKTLYSTYTEKDYTRRENINLL